MIEVTQNHPSGDIPHKRSEEVYSCSTDIDRLEISQENRSNCSNSPEPEEGDFLLSLSHKCREKHHQRHQQTQRHQPVVICRHPDLRPVPIVDESPA